MHAPPPRRKLNQHKKPRHREFLTSPIPSKKNTHQAPQVDLECAAPEAVGDRFHSCEVFGAVEVLGSTDVHASFDQKLPIKHIWEPGGKMDASRELEARS